jgi:hypothetical protein
LAARGERRQQQQQVELQGEVVGQELLEQQQQVAVR